MVVGVEVVCEKSVPVLDGNHFETMMRAGGEPLPQSRGHDEYRLNARILGGRRLAATGRCHVADVKKVPLGLGPVEAAPAVPCHVPHELASELSLDLSLSNPVLLSPGLVADHLGLAVIGERGRIACLPLARPDISVEWLGRGRFRIGFGEALTKRALSRLDAS